VLGNNFYKYHAFYRYIGQKSFVKKIKEVYEILLTHKRTYMNLIKSSFRLNL